MSNIDLLVIGTFQVGDRAPFKVNNLKQIVKNHPANVEAICETIEEMERGELGSDTGGFWTALSITTLPAQKR